MNRWVRLGLQTAFGIALLWLWVRTVSLTDVASHIRVQRWWVLPLMVLIFVITSVMRARRWQWLLRSLAPVGMVRAFAMNAAGGLLNYVLPIRSGDAARAWWRWRRPAWSRLRAACWARPDWRLDCSAPSWAPRCLDHESRDRRSHVACCLLASPPRSPVR